MKSSMLLTASLPVDTVSDTPRPRLCRPARITVLMAPLCDSTAMGLGPTGTGSAREKLSATPSL